MNSLQVVTLHCKAITNICIKKAIKHRIVHYKLRNEFTTIQPTGQYIFDSLRCWWAFLFSENSATHAFANIVNVWLSRLVYSPYSAHNSKSWLSLKVIKLRKFKNIQIQLNTSVDSLVGVLQQADRPYSYTHFDRMLWSSHCRCLSATTFLTYAGKPKTLWERISKLNVCSLECMHVFWVYI